MIIERLELQNIGVIGRRQTLDLRPKRGKSIALIGGKNGAGKTTILEAIQWALYGMLASSPRRAVGESSSYSDYLRRLRHRDAADDEAFVELRLSFKRGRKALPAIVRRSIRPGDKRVSERLEVTLDGSRLSNPASEWPVHMDAVLPTQLCPLFFFDGEQIESMVDPARSQRFLRSGVHALLGVDLIDQLIADLETLERRERMSSVKPSDLANVESLGTRFEELTGALREAREDEASARTELDQAEKELAAAESSFRMQGGTLYEQREVTKSELGLAERQREKTEGELRELADGVLPLCLLFPQLAGHHRLLCAEREAWQTVVEAQTAVRILVQLEDWLATRDVDGRLLEEISEFRSTKGLPKVPNEASAGQSGQDDPVRGRLEAVIKSGLLSDATQRGRALLAELRATEEQIGDLSRSLAMAAEEEDVKSLQVAVNTAAERRGRAQALLRSAETRVHQLELELEQVGKSWQRDLRKARLAEHDSDKMMRVLGACEQTSELMASFRTSVVKSNLNRIQSAVWRRFRQLLQKEGLGHRLRIDPKSYELSILDSRDKPLPPERLSAGERQLLATSVLWGLASVSGRKLPVIIDTPLGRLDTGHRANLVTEYFPNAGSQVILLSTDEEIDHRWHASLAPHIAHSYTLRFDDATQSSSVHTGYFEECAIVA